MMMALGKIKPPQGGQAKEGFDTAQSKSIFTYLGEAIKRRVWLLGYELEDARQLHAACGHFWKVAGACMALALLRFWRLA